METINKEKTLGEIVAANYQTADVFQKYGLDFCCQGNRSLQDVCKENEISVDKLVLELNEALKRGNNRGVDYNSWPLDLLADVIEKRHHSYVEEKIPMLKQFLQKLCDVHGTHHPELFEIKALFTQSADDLTTHMKKEELMLFPFIRNLENARKSKKHVASSQFDSVQKPVDMMMDDHEAEGDRFRKINSLTHGYAPPEDACNTYQITYAMLKDFEEDLHLHIHLENNILFPRSVELERELTQT